MNDIDLTEFDSAKKMAQFGAANNDILKNNAMVLSDFQSLEADIAELDSTAAARISAKGVRRDGTFDKNSAADLLETLIRKVAATAKQIKKREPDFDNTFTLPRGAFTEQGLLDYAHSYKNDLPPVTAKFAEFGMSADLLTLFETRIGAVNAGAVEQNTGAGSGIAATAQQRATIKRLKQTRRNLTIVVGNMLDELGDAGKIAEWKSACRIERASKKKKDASPTS